MNRTVAVAAAASVLLTVSACGSASSVPPASGGDPLFSKRATAVARAWEDQGLLDRWRTAFVPVQPLTAEPSWGTRDSLKLAFYGGWVRTATRLPAQAGTGEVRYAEGTPVPVRTLGAQAAYDAMVNPRSGECPGKPGGTPGDCDWVTVTAARPLTTEILTPRGPATVPAWAFTVEGLAEPIVRVSVEGAAEPGDFEPRLDPAATEGRETLLFGQDVDRAEGVRLTFRVGGGACDTEVRPHVVETDSVVIVGATGLGPKPDQVCTMMLQLHELTVTLKAPVDDRPVLDAASGRPLLPPVAAPSGPSIQPTVQ